MSSIVLGIAALVAMNSFNDNLMRDVDNQAASLVGADVVIEGRVMPSAALMDRFDSIPGEKASEKELLSMAYLPKSDESQFVRIKALEGDFPFYGTLNTEPAGGRDRLSEGQVALVEESIMIQHGLVTGDSVKVGELYFEIIAVLKGLFGSTSMAASFAPPIYIHQRYLEPTELIQPGSMVEHIFYAKAPETFDADAWERRNNDRFRAESIRIETISEQKEDLNEAFTSLNSFLNLVALVALLLGCIGVASSVFIYVKNKVASIAIFRCLGMKAREAFMIFFLQIFSLGLISVLLGAALGTGIQMVLPEVLKDFLPYEVDLAISWGSIVQGVVIGTVITSLFALVPLISIRRVSPLHALRASYESGTSRPDPVKWAIYAAIILSIFAFLWNMTGRWQDGLVFTLGLALSFIVFFLVARLVIWLVRKYVPRRWNFVFRQGLANLQRPNNQTQTLLVSLGLGTAVLTTLFVIQGLILRNVDQMDAGNQPNVILYGIERTQMDSLAEMTEAFEMPVIQQVPIVTMKIAGWKGRSKADWIADSTNTARRWAYNREARVTFRDTLDAFEELVRGDYTGQVAPGDSIYISMEEDFAQDMDLDIGDEIEFDVQGARITTYLGSTRTIDFTKMRTRFFILFPTGVLEEAPQFQVLVSKSPDVTTTARYRSEVVKAFPNVSVVDLSSILETLNGILSKVSYIVKFMAGFSILTGLIVLISSLFLSKFQRIKESVLLRTLGASRRQIFRINTTEYFVLGSLAALTGIVIAIGSAYLITRFQLEIPFSIEWLPILLVYLFIVGLTVVIGLLNSREVVNSAPLEVLRKEIG
ncbi:MAG: FtsX-like permease family protein [Saprospiraceae bacterium]|nr:FtsX-like permease family protein [Saprospiraceae bacterium]